MNVILKAINLSTFFVMYKIFVIPLQVVRNLVLNIAITNEVIRLHFYIYLEILQKFLSKHENLLMLFEKQLNLAHFLLYAKFL